MAVTSSGSSYNVFSSMGIKNNGIGGLASGLNTDDIVKAMTSSTRNRIALQQQKKQTLNWKMTAYRSVTKLLSNFQQKYFSYSKASSSNIMSPEFFNTYKASSSSSAVSVSGGNSAVNFEIESVDRLATAQYVTQKNSLAKALVGGTAIEAGADYTGKTLRLDVDGVTKSISLDSLNAYSGANQKAQFKEQLQLLIDDAFGTKKAAITDSPTSPTGKGDSFVLVDFDGSGNLKISSDTAAVRVASNSDVLGLKADMSNRVDLTTKIKDIEGLSGNLIGDTFTFKINDVEISVNANDTLSTLRNRVNASTANVTMTYDSYRDEFRLTSKLTGGGDFLKIEDKYGNLMNQIFGAQSGSGIQSKQLLSGDVTADNELGFESMATRGEQRMLVEELAGKTFSLTIDGVTKNVALDKDYLINIFENGSGSVMVTNEELAESLNRGIKKAFGEDTEVKFVVNGDGKMSIDGGGSAVTLANSSTKASDNFISSLGFDKHSYTNILKTTPTLNTDILKSSKVDLAAMSPEQQQEYVEMLQAGSFELTINGLTKTVSAKFDESVLKALEDDGKLLTYKDITTALNNGIKEQFGGELKAGFGYSEKDKIFTLSASTDTIVSVNDAVNVHDNGEGGTYTTGPIFTALGFTTEDTYSYTNVESDTLAHTTLADIGVTADGKININGKDYEFDADMSVRDFMDKLTNESNGDITASIVNGRIALNSKSGSIDMKGADANGTAALNAIFGMESYKTEAASYGDNMVRGENSEITLKDGTVISRSSNSFDLYGVTLTLNNVTTDEDTTPIKISSTSNPDEVVQKIKDFIDEYNALIETINTMIYEEANSDYPPLSDEQKSQMSSTEIESWENLAKQGILRNDSTLMGIVQQFRLSMYQMVDSAGIAGYSIGITTKSTMNGNVSRLDNGKLEITAAGEELLRSALTNDPDMVREFFTNKEDGLSVRFNNIINSAIESSSDPTKRGSLVRIAGTEALTGDNTSILGNQISALDKMLSSLKTRLESEHNRYWAQFSRLETSIQNMNTQSSWLTDFGS